MAISRTEIEAPALSTSMRVLRRLLFLGAYFGWVKHSMNRRVLTKSLGFSLTVPPTVFHPKFYFSSKFLGEYIASLRLDGKNVLDLGCGSGILSLAAARAGATVTAIDINPSAVEATRQNAADNGLTEAIRATQSDIFDRLDHSTSKFDIIVCNPPFYPGEPKSLTDRAFRGGDGMEFLVIVAHSSPLFLRPGGSLLLVLSSDADLRNCLAPFEINRFRVRILKVKKLFFERLTIIELQPT